MDRSVNAHEKHGNKVVAWVWYGGTDALKKGEAVCYNTDYGSATAADARRGNRVERPNSSNNTAFAGVAARDYFAKATGQMIEIYCPGSQGVEVALGTNTTIGTGILTFQVGGGSAAGRFVKAGFPGRGSIIPRQTKADAVLESGMTGGWSLAVDGVTLTVSDTTGISAGDTIVLLGGEDEGDSKAIVAGKYTVSSITSGTVLVLSSSAVGATPGAALTCTGYAYTGNPCCLADLLEGDESGGIEFISPPNTGDDDGDGLSFMAGGVSYICGGVTIGTEDANGALADGSFFGQKKGFHCLGALTTNDAQVTLATTGEQVTVTDAIETAGDGTPLDLDEATFDAAGEFLFLQWWGIWRELAHSGCALA